MNGVRQAGMTGAMPPQTAMENRSVPSADLLKQAFSLFPSGVVIATTVDSAGKQHGFTASSFTPLSVDPPMVLVCLNVSAHCFDVFSQARHFAISVLRPEHHNEAMRFATRGVDKFEGASFEPGQLGLPCLRNALASFECSVVDRYPGGDHAILTGLVECLSYQDNGSAMVHFLRSFRHQAI